MGTSGAGQMRTILAAARAGKLSPASARKWARRARAGHDISMVEQLAPGLPRPRPEVLSTLANDLAAILATGTRPGSYLSPGEPMSDEEADLLYPPHTVAEAERRARMVQAAAADVASRTDDELRAVLFGDYVFAPDDGAAAAAAPGHQTFTGQHTHQHPAYETGGSGPVQHSHQHQHQGDANHAHDHAGG